MKKVSEKILKPMVALTLIITLCAVDVVLLSVQLISYAIGTIQETNEANVLFASYFLDEEGNRRDSIEKTMMDENIKLYVEVDVQREGYFNGQIEFQNSNFKIIGYTPNPYVKGVSDNIVELNQINATNNIIIELAIQPIKNEVYELSLLNRITTAQITGTYVVGDNKNKEISFGSDIQLILNQPFSDITQENIVLLNKIVTNRIYNIDGENKRIVQFEIESRLRENAFPIRTTLFNVNVLPGTQQVKVQKRGTYATNNDRYDVQSNWNEEESTLDIQIDNPEENGMVSWNRNSTDKILVTYVLDENTQVQDSIINLNSQIQLYDYNSVVLNSNVQTIVESELDGVIGYEINYPVEIYKGNLYYGEDYFVESESIIDVRFEKISDTITLREGNSQYITDIGEKTANFEYVTSKINKYEILNVIGTAGQINIKTFDDNIIISITREYIESVEGDTIEINYNNQNELILEMINVENAGRISIKHTKTLRENNYTKQDMKDFIGLNIQGTVSADKNFDGINLSSYIKLNEPESVALLNSNVNTLSTLQKNENVQFNVILKSDDAKYNLYRNPIIEMEFPSEITDISAQLNPVYMEGFNFKVGNIYDNENGNKTIRIELEGEQTRHSNIVSEGIMININADIDVDRIVTTKDTEILLRYSNENEGNTILENKLPIKLQAKSGLNIFNKLENYNKNGDKLETSELETLTGNLDLNSEARTVDYHTTLINNYEEQMENVKIIGNFSEKTTIDGNIIDNISVDGVDYKIIYSEDGENWVEDKNIIHNIKFYGIELGTILVGNAVNINIKFNIPENLLYDEVLNAIQEITYVYRENDYNEKMEVELKTISLNKPMMPILSTSMDVTGELEVTTQTTKGEKPLNDGDSVYEGETLKNIIILTNKTGKDLTNVRVSVDQQNGVIYDLIGEERINWAISEDIVIEHVYDEWSEGHKDFDVIEKIPSGSLIALTYETTVNEVESDNENTYGQISIEANEIDKISKNTISNKIEQAELKVHTKSSLTEEAEIYSNGGTVPSEIVFKNLSGNRLDNTEFKVQLPDNMYMPNGDLTDDSIIALYDMSEEYDLLNDRIENFEYDSENHLLEFKIKDLQKDEELRAMIRPKINSIDLDKEEDVAVINTMATTLTGKSYLSNTERRLILQGETDIVINQITDVDEGAVLKDGDNFNIEISIANRTSAATRMDIQDDFCQGFIINNAKLIKNDEEIDLKEYISEENSLVYNEQIDANEVIKLQFNISLDTFWIEDDDTSVSNYMKITVGELLYESNEININIYKELSEMANLEEPPIENEYIDYHVEEEKDVVEEDDEEAENTGDITDNSSNNGTTNNGNESNNTNNSNNSNNNGSNKSNKKTNKISGIVWLDSNKNGQRENSENKMSDIKVMLLDNSTGKFVKDENGNDLVKSTDSNGKYEFSVEAGEYIVVFIYDTTKYSITTYQLANISEKNNNDAIEKQIDINSEKKNVGITDVIKIVDEDISNIDIGLVENKVFDLKLDKYISKVSVQNAEGTTTNNYEKQQLAKVEIKGKYFNGSTVVVEYGIDITNEGEVEGNVNEIIDYIPSGFKFNSELNKDWYLGNDGNLHTTSLKGQKIKAGETKTVKLILTKTLTVENGGLVINTAEIYKSSNDQNIADRDSIPGNKADKEDDISNASLIISIKTGMFAITLIVIAILCIVSGCVILIWKRKEV